MSSTRTHLGVTAAELVRERQRDLLMMLGDPAVDPVGDTDSWALGGPAPEAPISALVRRANQG